MRRCFFGRKGYVCSFVLGSPLKFNMEPENDGLEDVSPFPGLYSQVPC